MNRILLSGILASVPFFFWTFWQCRTLKIGNFAAFMLACAVMPAPIAMLLSGRASYLYALDLVAPLLAITVAKDWPGINRSVKKAVVLVVVGAGVIPIVSMAMLRENTITLGYAINLYRVAAVGVVALYFASLPSDRKQDVLTRILLGLIITLIIGLVLQLAGAIDINAYKDEAFMAESGTSLEDLYYAERYSVFNFFRASLGLFGCQAIAVGIALFAWGKSYWRSGFLFLAGFILIILVGSKTSAAIGGLMLVGAVMLSRTIGRRLLAGGMALVIVLVCIKIITDPVLKSMLPVGTDLDGYAFSAENLTTLSSRTVRWEENVDLLMSNPLILFGAQPPLATFRSLSQDTLQVGLLHNEYLEVLMRGGLPALSAYLAGLYIFCKVISRSPRGPVKLGAGLLMAVGIIHGFTVGHLQPALLLTHNVLFFLCYYCTCLEPVRRPGLSRLQRPSPEPCGT